MSGEHGALSTEVTYRPPGRHVGPPPAGSAGHLVWNSDAALPAHNTKSKTVKVHRQEDVLGNQSNDLGVPRQEITARVKQHRKNLMYRRLVGFSKGPF